MSKEELKKIDVPVYEAEIFYKLAVIVWNEGVNIRTLYNWRDRGVLNRKTGKRYFLKMELRGGNYVVKGFEINKFLSSS